jgi:hypothetical protein
MPKTSARLIVGAVTALLGGTALVSLSSADSVRPEQQALGDFAPQPHPIASIASLDLSDDIAPGADLATYQAQGGDLERFREFVAQAIEKPVDKVRLLRTLPHRSVVLATASGMICVRNRVEDHGGGMGCAPETSATDPATPIIATDQVNDSTYTVTALLADGVKGIEVVDRSGATTTLESVNNVATGTLAQPVHFSWQTTDGKRYEYEPTRDPSAG